MNANEIAFGIEFETTLPGTDNTPIGPYHNGYQVPWLPTGWKAERDGSEQWLRNGKLLRRPCDSLSNLRRSLTRGRRLARSQSRSGRRRFKGSTSREQREREQGKPGLHNAPPVVGNQPPSSRVLEIG